MKFQIVNLEYLGCEKMMIDKMPETNKIFDLELEKHDITYIDKHNDFFVINQFIKKFRIVNSIVPISISLFANSSIVEKKKSNYLSYRAKVWQNTYRGGLPKILSLIHI